MKTSNIQILFTLKENKLVENNYNAFHSAHNNSMAQGPKSGRLIKGSKDDILHHYHYHYVKQHTKPEGNNNNNRFNNRISIEDNLRNLSKDFSELNNKGYKYNREQKPQRERD